MNLIARGPPRSCTFRIAQRDGVWSVTKDNIFYGDYLSREQATRGACYGARAVEAVGGEVRVLMVPGDKLLSHREAPGG